MFYVMGRLWADSPARRPDRSSFDRQGLWWDDGVRFERAVKTPVRVALMPFEPRSPDESPSLPALIDGVVPLFRLDLLAVLADAGVTNLDLYDAELLDPDDGSVHADYKAVNIIGVVAAADLGRSTATIHDGLARIDVSFDRLVIDSDKAAGLRLFRLAENTSAIVVDGVVRNAVLGKGLTEIQFFKPENIAL